MKDLLATNKKIDELAYSLKNDNLSEGRREYVETQLYSKIMEYKGLRINGVSKTYDNNKEKDEFNEREAGMLDKPLKRIVYEQESEAFYDNTFTSQSVYADEVLTENIEEVYTHAWKDYVSENDTFRKVNGSFIKMFNIYLKIQNLGKWEDINRNKLGETPYNAKKSMVKYTLITIMQELKVKDFNMPKNVMNQDKVENLIRKHSGTDNDIAKIRQVFDTNFKVMDANDDEEDGDYSIFDVVSKNNYIEEDDDGNDKLSTAVHNYIVSKAEEYGNNKIRKKYFKCYLSLQVAKCSEEDLDSCFNSISKYIDWDMVKRYREADRNGEIESDIQFVADYLHLGYDAVQDNLKKIKDFFGAAVIR